MVLSAKLQACVGCRRWTASGAIWEQDSWAIGCLKSRSPRFVKCHTVRSRFRPKESWRRHHCQCRTSRRRVSCRPTCRSTSYKQTGPVPAFAAAASPSMLHSTANLTRRPCTKASPECQLQRPMASPNGKCRALGFSGLCVRRGWFDHASAGHQTETLYWLIVIWLHL